VVFFAMLRLAVAAQSLGKKIVRGESFGLAQECLVEP
jgi:hypothetical protein